MSTNILTTGIFRIECPKRLNINVKFDKSLFTAQCISCPLNWYTISPNSIDITSFSNLLESLCSPCPPGALCEGAILSIDNYHGIKSSSTTLKFMPCPSGYCCTSQSTKCKSYNTCEKGRAGLMCSSCSPGYKQSFMSDKCVPIDDSSCNPPYLLCTFLFLHLHKQLYLHFYPYLPNCLKN